VRASNKALIYVDIRILIGDLNRYLYFFFPLKSAPWFTARCYEPAFETRLYNNFLNKVGSNYQPHKKKNLLVTVTQKR